MTNCPKCHGTGKIPVDKKEIEIRKEKFEKIGIVDMKYFDFDRCDCRNPEYDKYISMQKDLNTYKDISKNINIPPKYKNFCFEMYKKPIPASVIELLKNKQFKDLNGVEKNGFLFWGYGAGTGKTLLAISIAHSLSVEYRMTFRYENTTMFLYNLKRFFNQDRQDKMYTELDYLEKLVNMDILIMDDIGTEKVSEWVKEKFYFIQENRSFYNDKITIYTSNDDIDTLANKIGDKIVSRIIESCQAIEFTGEDWRLKLNKKGDIK